jgi:hypothetical protein
VFIIGDGGGVVGVKPNARKREVYMMDYYVQAYQQVRSI